MRACHSASLTRWRTDGTSCSCAMIPPHSVFRRKRVKRKTLARIRRARFDPRPRSLSGTGRFCTMRLKDKVAIVVGAGQSPGEGMGNGRATVLRFAQEGAKVFAVDNNPASAEETSVIARQAGGEVVACV